MIARLHKILFSNYGSLSIDTRLYGPYLIVRSSVFENNVSRYSVVINTVSDYEISPLHYYIWSGSFLDFSHAVSDQIQIRFSRFQFMKVRSTCAAKILYIILIYAVQSNCLVVSSHPSIHP